MGNDNTLTVLQHSGLSINKNGYLYIYVSNETSNIDVYFDNLQVTHIRGPLLQVEGYYLFGLEMQGISSNALNFGSPNNAYKFNGGDEWEESINLYSTFFRGYDPQLGRFSGIDMLSEQSGSVSPYQFGLNNPILFNDPSGLTADIFRKVGDFFKRLFGIDHWEEGPYGPQLWVRKPSEQNDEPDDGGDGGGSGGGGGGGGISQGGWNTLGSMIGGGMYGGSGSGVNSANSPITSSPSSLGTGSTVNIGLGPRFIGKIDVDFYDEWHPGFTKTPSGNPDPMDGVDIRLSFQDYNSGFTNFEWIQTIVWTDAKGNCETFTDPKNSRQLGHWPFYYSLSDLTDPLFAPRPGYQEFFYDRPAHRPRPFVQSTEAELTLVGFKNGSYFPLITFKYGFNMAAGSRSVQKEALTVIQMYPAFPSDLSLNQMFNILLARPR